MRRFEGKPIDMGVLAGDEVRSEINSISNESKDWKFDDSNSKITIIKQEKTN